MCTVVSPGSKNAQPGLQVGLVISPANTCPADISILAYVNWDVIEVCIFSFLNQRN